ncbi:MAG: hypothetical protein IPJ65_38045 [Archangiaceae bacterium]|nr:hypothetical protein [Archangiaceae bacterium]
MSARLVMAAHPLGTSFALRPSVAASRGENRKEPFDVSCPRCTALDARQLLSPQARLRTHDHALDLSHTAIEAALEFGRCVRSAAPGSSRSVARRSRKYQRDGVDLREFEGTQVVVTASGAVMTVYRNSDWSLRTRRRRSFRR